MGAPAKFLFDQDFSKPVSRPDNIAAAELATKVAEAEARGARNGHAAAQAEASADNTRRHAIALQQIASSFDAVAARLDQATARIEAEAVDVALAVARKLSGALIAREPLEDIMALISDCLRHLVSTPHIAIRINDQLYDQAREQIDALAKKSGFQGRLVILAEPDIANGDCSIEWADGGVTSNRAATEARIAELVARYMAARDTTKGIEP